MNYEFDRMWNETAVAYCEVLYINFLGVMRKITKNLTQYTQRWDQDLNSATSAYESELLTTQTRFSVLYLYF
jgi:flagellar capping protein FliD